MEAWRCVQASCGTLVYSTCALDPIQNEAVVAAALAAHPSLRLVPAAEALPAETAAAAFVERPPGHLFDLQTLVMNEDAFDVDGYSATFEGEQALEGLELRLPETHPMASMAANQPKARKLYDPASFGLMGLALPREHVGMGLAIQRNR